MPQRNGSQAQQGRQVLVEGPLTVERAVEEALRASPELEQMRQRLEAAAEQVRQVEAVLSPPGRFEDFNITNNPSLP